MPILTIIIYLIRNEAEEENKLQKDLIQSNNEQKQLIKQKRICNSLKIENNYSSWIYNYTPTNYASKSKYYNHCYLILCNDISDNIS